MRIWRVPGEPISRSHSISRYIRYILQVVLLCHNLSLTWLVLVDDNSLRGNHLVSHDRCMIDDRSCTIMITEWRSHRSYVFIYLLWVVVDPTSMTVQLEAWSTLTDASGVSECTATSKGRTRVIQSRHNFLICNFRIYLASNLQQQDA